MPNVILLLSDEHNPFFSSVYGHPFIQTPNMERLAQMGTVYQNAYCPSPLCFPSRTTFMTGKRVHEVQAYSNCNVNVKKDYISYGRVLHEQGIHSVHIGKTDVHDRGENLGFSEILMPKDRAIPGDTSFARNPLFIRKGAAERANGFGVKEDAFMADLKVMDTALNWLDNSAQAVNKPWTLAINILNPHFPQWNTQEFWDMYPTGGDLPQYGIDCESACHPYAEDLRNHFEAGSFTEEQVRGLRRGYLGNISFVDQQLGRLLDLLEQTGLIEDTNIIYTSDHGDMMGKFGLWWKCSLYEDSVRVPCIAAGPDFTKGIVIQTPVDLLDVQAALFQSVGAKRPSDWTGSPLQEIPINDEERVVFSEYHGHGTRSGAYMIRKGDWKLIYYMEGPHQLFNLAYDPDELHNLYEDFPRKSMELEAELRKICSPEIENQRAHDFQEEQLSKISSVIY